MVAFPRGRHIWRSGWARPAILCLAAAVVLAAVFVREDAYGKLRELYYGYEAGKAYAQELKNLRRPLDALGFKGVTGGASRCTTQAYYGYGAPKLVCRVYREGYVVTSTAAQKAAVISAAKVFDEQLRANGWTSNQNASPTIEAWLAGVTSGKDWYPDEGGYKNTKHAHCAFDFFEAYSNPNPPAFTLQFTCSSPVLDKLKDLPS